MTAPAYIPSPCVGICTLEGNLCVGCCRTSHDIMNWGRWTDHQRVQALALRHQTLSDSFDALFSLEDESLLWACWDQHVAWYQRPELACEAWLQILQAAPWKHLPDAMHCGVSGRFALQTRERKKALQVWLDHLQLLRAQG